MVAKKQQNSKEVHIELPDLAGEYRFFDLFRVERRGDFVFLKLTFSGGGKESSVFDGAGSVADCLQNLKGLKDYVARIGAPDPASQDNFQSTMALSSPVSFHHLSCMMHHEVGELLISQFSHKFVYDAVHEKKVLAQNVKAKTHGVYTSPIEIHKALVFELIGILVNDS